MFCTSAPGWVRCRTGWAGHYPPVTAGNTHCDLLRWFDQLDEHPTGVLGVDEVDPRVGRATPRLVVQQAQAALAQDCTDRVDVGDPIGHLLDAGALAVEELRDRRALVERCEQLDAGAGVADRHHRLADA